MQRAFCKNPVCAPRKLMLLHHARTCPQDGTCNDFLCSFVPKSMKRSSSSPLKSPRAAVAKKASAQSSLSPDAEKRAEAVENSKRAVHACVDSSNLFSSGLAGSRKSKKMRTDSLQQLFTLADQVVSATAQRC